MKWVRFLKVLVGGFVTTLVVVFAFVVWMNPYGNLPGSRPWLHVIMDENQRFQYPAVIRSGEFDSFVVGTSSSRLLQPSLLEDAFGGRFANLAMDDARAWEQFQLASLFLSEVPRPRTLLFGIDWVWCTRIADSDRVTNRGFPEWMYDDDPWNDLAYQLNARTFEIAGLQAIHRLGWEKPTIQANGFAFFVPHESRYDLEKARNYIWRGAPRTIQPVNPPYVLLQRERRQWSMPALRWLDDLLARVPNETLTIFAHMPQHIAEQPVPGSRKAARIRECKDRIAAIAARHGAHIVDFWIRSPITTEDSNYWDAVHYRLGIAERIIDGIGAAVTGAQKTSSDWIYTPPPKHPVPAKTR